MHTQVIITYGGEKRTQNTSIVITEKEWIVIPLAWINSSLFSSDGLLTPLTLNVFIISHHMSNLVEVNMQRMTGTSVTISPSYFQTDLQGLLL